MATDLVADPNSNADSWRWCNEGWELAQQSWQDFSAEWWGATCKTIEKSLSLPKLFAESPRTVLVRDCYVDMFHSIFNRGLAWRGDSRVVITGQPRGWRWDSRTAWALTQGGVGAPEEKRGDGMRAGQATERSCEHRPDPT